MCKKVRHKESEKFCFGNNTVSVIGPVKQQKKETEF